MKNKHNLLEERSISDSIDDLYPENKSYDESISAYALEYIWGGSYMHPDINTINARFKIN